MKEQHTARMRTENIKPGNFLEPNKMQNINDKNKLKIFVIITLAIVIFDQLTKHILNSIFEPHVKHYILKPLSITLTFNTGAGFSLFQNKTIFLAIFSIVFLCLIIFFFNKIPADWSLVFFALMFGGALGNLIDRLFLGHVIDFIDFGFFPVFNVADSAISVGAVLLAIYVLKSGS